MNKSDAFLRLFNQLESFLRDVTKSDKTVTFYRLVDVASQTNRIIRNNKMLLQKYGDLRNFIVHNIGVEKEPIADPSENTIRVLESICKSIINPVKVIPKYLKKIDIFRTDNHLIDAIQYMHKNDFSQICVMKDKQVVLLTSEGIVQWLGEQIEIGLADIQNATIAETLEYESAYFVFVARDNTVDNVYDQFDRSIQNKMPRLQAAIITENGNQSESPIGIITPWDIVSLKI